MVRAADAAAQLMQLRQPEPIGAIDQDGIGARHVDAALDDGRAHQQIEASVIEIDHELLELALAHLAVADAHVRLRHQRWRARRPIFSMLWISLWTKYTWPPRRSSRSTASRSVGRMPLDHEGLDRQRAPPAAS